MTTTYTLIVVIIALTCNVALLYFLSDIRKMAMLSLVVWGGLLVCSIATYNCRNYALPVVLAEEIQNPEGRKAMMTAFNVTEEDLLSKVAKPSDEPTPIEQGVGTVLVLALVFTPILLNVVRGNGDETEKKKVHQAVFSLNIVAGILLLSLYFGLKLTVMPFYNKMFGKDRKDLPNETQQKLAQSNS